MIRWLYVWSPKYTLFHHVLYNQIFTLPGIQAEPVFMKQSVFDRKEGEDGKHFLTGIGIKIYVLLKNLEKYPGEFVIFSDVDILCLKSNIAEILQKYEINDITCMRENLANNDYNIGCMLVKSTPQTIQLFTKVLERIRTENRLDQDVFMEEIKTFPGPHGHFALPSFIQSNMVNEYPYQEHEFAIIQCLSSEMNSTKMMIQKIATLASFFDITRMRHFLSSSLEDELRTHLERWDPSSYILQWQRRLLPPNEFS